MLCRLSIQPLEIVSAEGPIQPHVCELFLNTVGAEPLVKIFEIDKVEMLVLVKAGEDEELFAGVRVDVPLQTLGTDLFHHALHRRVY